MVYYKANESGIIMSEVIDKFKQIGIIPVVALDDASQAPLLGEALLKGGLAAAEVTFRTDAAEESIRLLTREFPDMYIGAGTVLSTNQADRAIAAGARFIVSPGLNSDVVRHCIDRGYPIVPGVQTPSEIERALSLGLTFVKFFPAEPAGGLSMIKAVAAPYSNVLFMPTGGINVDNVRQYLAYDRIVACGGTWMVKKDLINTGQFDEIERLSKEASEIVREVRGGKRG